MFRKLYQLLASMVLILSFATVADAQIVWKLGHNRQDDTPVGQAVIKFAKRVDELTKGELKINIFPNAQLGDWSVISERVSLGVVEMGFIPQSSQSDKRISVYYFPGLFKDLEHMKRNMLENPPFRKALDDLLIGQNLYPVAQWPAFFGAASFVSMPKNWENVAAAKDLKVRTAKDPTLVAVAEILGFLPTPMPSSESYTALQTGVVDGVFGPGVEGHYNWFRDVIEYISPINDHMEIFSLVVNTEIWEELDDNLKTQVAQAAREIELDRYATFYEDEAFWINKAKEAGVKILPFSDAQASEFFRIAKEEYWPELAKKLDEKYINDLLGKLKP